MKLIIEASRGARAQSVSVNNKGKQNLKMKINLYIT